MYCTHVFGSFSFPTSLCGVFAFSPASRFRLLLLLLLLRRRLLTPPTHHSHTSSYIHNSSHTTFSHTTHLTHLISSHLTCALTQLHHHKSHNNLGRRSIWSSGATFAWQVQNFDSPGCAGARLDAAGLRLLSRGRRSTWCTY